MRMGALQTLAIAGFALYAEHAPFTSKAIVADAME